MGGVAALAITAHKVPSSLSLAAILRAEGRRPVTVLWMCALYGLMVPVGAALYGLLDAAVHLEALASWALAFSAGTFLYIAVSDLLPHVNRHGKDRRVANVLALAVGLGVMLLISLIGAAIVAPRRLSFLYAALATIALLLEQGYWVLAHEGPKEGFVQSGLLAIGCFVGPGVTGWLAQRVVANEALARQRGRDALPRR